MLVLPFGRTESQLVASYALFGKLPNRPDFVRVNATHSAVMELDGVIQRAFELRSFEGAGGEWSPLVGMIDFQYVTQDRRHVMVGVLTPSLDQAGRCYPLVAAVILPRDSIERYLRVSPIAYEVFFDGLREQVINAVENSVEALSCRQFLEGSLRTYEGADEDLNLALSVVDRFMSVHSAKRMADLLSAGAYPASLHQALLNLAFYLAHLRRFDNRATNQLFLFPLSDSKGEQALEASAWLTLIASLKGLGGQDGGWCGSYLITRRTEGGAQLVTTVGSVPSSFSRLMIGGEVESSMLLDLASRHDAWVSHRLYAEVSYVLGRLLADPDCRMAALAGFLEDMSQRLEGGI
ncbi:MAG: type VI secretion system-associated protein TagF [Rhodocyclales bacterium GT-UBC]|nr:MAG: type VI secretion system-associated protein TagF [Rhodocyclales bacterium GT-UBC]